MKHTTTLRLFVLVFFCTLPLTTSQQFSQALSFAAPDNTFDVNGIWISNDTQAEEVLKGIREAIAMGWGTQNSADENTLITLTDLEKRNPGGPVEIAVSEYLTLTISCQPVSEGVLREVFKPVINLTGAAAVKSGLTDTAILNACNDFNAMPRWRWIAFYNQDARRVFVRCPIILEDNYISWDSFMDIVSRETLLWGFFLSQQAAFPDAEQHPLIRVMRITE